MFAVDKEKSQACGLMSALLFSCFVGVGWVSGYQATCKNATYSRRFSFGTGEARISSGGNWLQVHCWRWYWISK